MKSIRIGLGIVAAAAATYASPIYVGETGKGLTAAYISGSANCVGKTLQGNSCVSGSTTGWVERNYDVTLFQGAQTASGAPVPYTGYVGGNSAAIPATVTDNRGISFQMLSDGTIAMQPDDYWAGNTSSSTLTVPIGLSQISSAYLMLNTYNGTPAGTDATVTFTFSSTPNGLPTNVVSINLTGAGANTTGSGQIRSAVDCTGGGATSALTACPGTSTGSLASSTVINGITVTTGNVFSAAYTDDTNSMVRNYHTSGTLNLDDQGFDLSSFLGQPGYNYLESIGVTSNSGTAAPGLSAITLIPMTSVSVAATPEPASVLSLAAGLLGIGALKFRKRSA